MRKPFYLRLTLSFIFLLLLMTHVQAQVFDFCGGVAEDIAYNQSIESSITDTNLFGRYCFRGRADDVVSIQISTIEGDLVLSGALSDRFVDEIYEEFTASNSGDDIEITFTLPADGSYILLISRENFGNGTTSGSYQLSLSSENEALANLGESRFPLTLENYANDWDSAISELQDLGAISTDGALIFNLETAFFDGLGSFFTPISSATVHRDVIVSAELSFTSDSDTLETCSLLARVMGHEMIDDFLEVGIDNQGDVFWVASSEAATVSGSAITALDLSESHHLMFIAQATSLTIYLDGQRLIDNEGILSGSGSFGIALLGGGMQSRCEANNMWGYTAPLIVEGLCEVTPQTDINRRSGASTGFAITGIIDAGDYVEVIAQTTETSGLIWYQLDDMSFVREDVVSLVGDCDNLATVE